jgi:hypothetical protein
MNRRPPVRRLTNDTGATLVEASFALPIVLFFLMGMVDLGSAELRNSQTTNAARDGARVGMIKWLNADKGTYTGGSCPAVSAVTPVVSANYVAICNAVKQRMAGAPINSLVVKCFTTTAVFARSAGCADTGTPPLTQGLDMLEVTVTSTFTPVTPTGQTLMGSSRTFTAKARMVIQ